MFDHRATIVISLSLLFYFLWMDVALFYHVHEQRPRTTPSSDATPPSSSIPSATQLISPFTGLSVKMMMMDPVNNYIFTPAAHIFNEVTNFSHVFYFVTPNMVSFLGLMFALGAGKCMAMDSRPFHLLALFLFQMRTFFDALDGIVARTRMGMIQHVSLRNTSGYVVDGVADAIGFAAFLIGCFQVLRSSMAKHKYYLPVSAHEVCRECKEGVALPVLSSNCTSVPATNGGAGQRRVFLVVLCFGLQLAVGAFFWDHYINAYHNLLESSAPTDAQTIAQSEVLKSSITWVLMWFWRMSNAHTFIQMLLFAIYINKMWEFLCWIQFVGFVQVFTLAFFTEMHLCTVRGYILSLS
ncbi:ceramide phosphoethanolamine synthase-like [Uloborus diversus]|uniref:ceramide phosphoethanolamine synthase-like n=1 Tax=Uloborus diversus TaxID=327109 RepID=UPI00240A2124|nr:ceramide phosphoethanolamine synthase-like [Uloborus diversus]XP_054717658.1 ceramide phosphoethanolamine synthase-like [Uloborus diversus]XP_054717659.1 ceramide phosphoethanolamine synthase-like [Uloborus diversus]